MYLKNLLVNWNVCRIVRIVGGTPIIIMGIQKEHWPSILFGAAFVALGLFTTQCCATGNCATGYSGTARKNDPVQFEEIK